MTYIFVHFFVAIPWYKHLNSFNPPASTPAPPPFSKGERENKKDDTKKQTYYLYRQSGFGHDPQEEHSGADKRSF